MKSMPYLEQFRHLKKYLILAGIKAAPARVFTLLYIATAVIDVSFLFFILYKISEYEANLTFVLIFSLIMLTLGYLLTFFLVWLFFLILIDYLKFKRKQALEEVLPEFLRLVSTNHRAGLPLDMSLWKANKPRFGVLSDEINHVARKTYATGNLIRPLTEFAEKYDSAMLKRAVTNLVEGLKTGADIASLLDDVATNIMTIRNTRKELASEVENYLLFITLTVLIISPFMFALTHNMSGIIENVKNTLAENTDSDTSGQLPISFEKTQDFGKYFDYFVYLMIATNSTVSVLLMSMVKYGNVKQELKRIPIYYLVCFLIYTVCKSFFGQIFAGIT